MRPEIKNNEFGYTYRPDSAESAQLINEINDHLGIRSSEFYGGVNPIYYSPKPENHFLAKALLAGIAVIGAGVAIEKLCSYGIQIVESFSRFHL